VKDAFHRYLHRRRDRCDQSGRDGNQDGSAVQDYSAGSRQKGNSPAPDSASIANHIGTPFSSNYDAVFSLRLNEADEFYQTLAPAAASEEECSVYRQALSGLLWSKQYYFFDLETWLADHGHNPLLGIRNPACAMQLVPHVERRYHLHA